MKIVLIGFMGSGKTTVAKSLSKKLNLEVVEMDNLIIKESKRSNINEIFAKDGENYFRELEKQISKSLKNKDNVIISTGGGVVMNIINIKYLKNNGKIIFLKTGFLEISRRLKNIKDRPLFQDKKNVKKLFDSRQKLYEENSDLIINTDGKSVGKISYEIISQN